MAFRKREILWAHICVPILFRLDRAALEYLQNMKLSHALFRKYFQWYFNPSNTTYMFFLASKAITDLHFSYLTLLGVNIPS